MTFGYTHVEGEPDAYVQDGRWIGNMYQLGTTMVAERRLVEGMTLSDLQLLILPDEAISLLKLDCEGCEWSVLTDTAIVGSRATRRMNQHCRMNSFH